MTARQGDDIYFDVAGDTNLSDSISFSGLLSIQDQQHRSSSKGKIHHHKKQAGSFEFSSSRLDDAKATNSVKCSPADVLISDGKLVAHAFTVQSKHSESANTSTVGSSSTVLSNGKRSVNGAMSRKGFDQPEHVSRKGFHKPNKDMSFFSSLVHPCRECNTAQPTMEAHNNASRENVKLK